MRKPNHKIDIDKGIIFSYSYKGYTSQMIGERKKDRKYGITIKTLIYMCKKYGEGSSDQNDGSRRVFWAIVNGRDRLMDMIVVSKSSQGPETTKDQFTDEDPTNYTNEKTAVAGHDNHHKKVVYKGSQNSQETSNGIVRPRERRHNRQIQWFRK